MKIGIGTVIRFKRSGDHVYCFGIIVHDKKSRYGERRVLYYDPEEKKADRMGWGSDFMLNCEIIGRENLCNVRFETEIGKYVGYKEYMRS